MYRKIVNFFFHPRLMAVAIFVFAGSMAVSTFIENDYGTTTAKILIYNTKWFELIIFLLVINFAGNISRYRLYRKEKWPIFLFHISFIIILLGSIITRYFGFEGIVPIREGQTTSTIYSDKTYITIRVDNNELMKSHNTEVLFGQSSIVNNTYSLTSFFEQNEYDKTPYSITMESFTPKAKEFFIPDEFGANTLHVVKSSRGIRQDIYLAEGEVKNSDNILLSFNHYIEGGINFFQDKTELSLHAPMDGSYMEMRSRNKTFISKDSISPLQLKHLYTFGHLNFVVVQVAKGKTVIQTAPKQERNIYPYDIISLKIESGKQKKIVKIRGLQKTVVPPKMVSLNGLNFVINYGSKEITMPFQLKLQDFQMEHYPGTNSASSYASEVTVIDTDKIFDYRIFMNHVLDYKGYRFFQSSYDKDEKGTILSVNHDYWGTIITYIGYSLMSLGMFMSLFWKGSNFSTRSKIIHNASHTKITMFLLFAIVLPLSAQNTAVLENNIVSKEHAHAFGKLLIQDYQGRIKPINTYALEVLRKVYKKNTYQGLTPEQILLSTQLNPKFWNQQYIIKVKTKELGNNMTIDLNVKNSFTTMNNVFIKGIYYLKDSVSESLRIAKTDRTATDQEIINLDERVNVWWNMINGNLLKIYPKKGDSNNKWYVGTDRRVFTAQDTMVLQMHQLYMVALHEAIITKDYSIADEYLELIAQYQRKLATSIIPSPQKIDFEIKYNQWSVFKKLLFYYMIVGLIILILSFVNLLNPTLKKIRVGLKISSFFVILGMLVHATGLGMRWYISGHEPWSNGYEAVVFVAFITIVAGLIFSYNRSKFTMASTVLFSSFLLGIAQGSMMNPEITNLVPVLKSYWLMIHVAVITASYGFLGLGTLLGFTVLLLYIIRTSNNAKYINSTIQELTYTNENALTVGLYALAIGTFLGGVWANESWGRYWSWDPKEVWALISIMVYVFVLHMRLVPSLRGNFIFNVASLFAISTLIMTFFGVNYYLSGMHSYAGGDPVPIPTWIYFTIIFFILFVLLAYIRHKKYTKHA